ncbi:MAG TPA: (Fe-S)-binding protein [Nevskiales bacterium]|nr:(Fe-S)-binding protein [Nevskiales bacterium]
MARDADTRFPLADADLCVKCGLCLPHCPTYRLSRDEGDSPRGRIALMQGLATGLIGPGARLEAHLDGCLTCRSCEAVCPAQVPYGRLIDAGRAELARLRPARSRLTRILGTVLANRALRRGIGWLLWLYRASRLQALVRRLHLLGAGPLARLESLLPSLPAPLGWKAFYPAIGTRQGAVTLFVGCVGELAERQALADGITLLTRLGYEVRVPPAQTCCGALHLHNGLPAQARDLARRNLAALADDSVAVVGSSSGCTATLREYAELLPAAADFGRRVEDIGVFLTHAQGWERLRFRPLALTVAVHEPCTLRNVLKGAGAAHALLARIPGLRLRPLAYGTGCCGAAGSYFLTQADTADRLAADMLASVMADPPDALVSSNVGCALHLSARLRRDGRPLPVLHPVSLLVRQLEPGRAAGS